MGYVEDLWVSKSGSATTRHGKGKRYRGVPWLITHPGGRGVRGATKTFHDRPAAEHYVAQVEAGDEAALEAAGHDPARARRRRRFADYVREVAATMGADGSANRGVYRSQANMLAAVWPTECLHEITRAMIESYFEELVAKGASGSTRAKRRAVLRETMSRAFRARFINDDPTWDTEPVRQERPELPEVSWEEMRAAMRLLDPTVAH